MFGFLNDKDTDRDEDRDHDRDDDRGRSSRSSYGRGFDRDDSPFASSREESFMPMTRRDADVDVDRLSDRTLRDTSAFLRKRDEQAKSRSTGQVALSVVEMFLGALAGGYLSQRFRATSGAIPTGLLLGGVAYGAAHFTQMFGRATEDVKNAAIGSALASGVIWAAGYGSLGAEKADVKADGNFPVTAGVPQHVPMQLPQQPAQAAWPTPAYQPAFRPPQGAPTVADFQSLVMQRGV